MRRLRVGFGFAYNLLETSVFGRLPFMFSSVLVAEIAACTNTKFLDLPSLPLFERQVSPEVCGGRTWSDQNMGCALYPPDMDVVTSSQPQYGPSMNYQSATHA